MERDDWIALGVSLMLHVLLLGGFSLWRSPAEQPQPLGFVEVEFSQTISEGQPVQRAPKTPAAPPEPTVEPEAEPETKLEEEPIGAKPIDLPDEDIADEEQVQNPEADEVDPTVPSQPAREEDADETEAASAPPAGGGETEGRTGQAAGDEGEGTDEEKTAPFKIEGLDRATLTSPLPRYAEKVNATIKVRITVNPQGRIVQRIPLLKGNPSLEQSVMNALQRWRFNALPASAPQENQTGVITFRFRLE